MESTQRRRRGIITRHSFSYVTGNINDLFNVGNPDPLYYWNVLASCSLNIVCYAIIGMKIWRIGQCISFKSYSFENRHFGTSRVLFVLFASNSALQRDESSWAPTTTRAPTSRWW